MIAEPGFQWLDSKLYRGVLAHRFTFGYTILGSVCKRRPPFFRTGFTFCQGWTFAKKKIPFAYTRAFVAAKGESELRMSKVLVTSQIELDLEEVLNGLARLNPKELEQFVERVLSLQAHRRAPALPPKEADLLQKINNGVAPAVRQRYRELNTKLLAEAISEEERAEFLAIVDQIEMADAERLQALIELAQLRSLTVDQLMGQLGIRRPVYA